MQGMILRSKRYLVQSVLPAAMFPTTRMQEMIKLESIVYIIKGISLSNNYDSITGFSR